MTLLTLLNFKGKPHGYHGLRNGLGLNSFQSLSNSLGVNSFQSIASVLGSNSYQQIINGIAAVNTTQTLSAVVGLDARQALDAPLSYSPQYQTLTNELAVIVTDYQTLINEISPIKVNSYHTLTNELGEVDFITDYQTIRNDIGGLRFEDPPIGETTYVDEFGNVKNIVDAPDGIVYMMSEDGATLLGFEPAITDVKIYINDMDYTSKIKNAEIDINESDIYNQCSISFKGLELFHVFDPDKYTNTLDREDNRIKIVIDNTIEYEFLLEQRKASETFESADFEIWGRSKTAILSEPYCDTMDYTLDANKSLKDVIAEVISDSGKSISVVYDYPNSADSIEDFTVMASAISYEDTFPIDIIEDLVDSYGAIVRTDADGNLVIRDKYKTRPQDMEDATETIKINRINHIISADWGYSTKENYSTVLVINNPSSEGTSFLIEEENDPVLNGGMVYDGEKYNNDVILQVYYNNRDALFVGRDYTPNKYTATVTDGLTQFLKVNLSPYYNVKTIAGEDAEFVQITNGVASVQYPILSITNVELIPVSPGVSIIPCAHYLVPELYGNEIKFYSTWGGSEESEDNVMWGCGLAKISYTTCYDRWRVYNTESDKVLFCLKLTEELHDMLQVTLSEAITLKEAEPIEDERLYSNAEAKHRGLTFLDDSYWNWVTRSIELPYLYDTVAEAALLDGDLLDVNDPEMEFEGIYKIEGIRISIELPKVSMEVSISQETVATLQ